MDDFNAKKSRAQKFRQDKYRDRHKKPPSASGKTAVKNVNQERSSKEKDVPKADSGSDNSDAEETATPEIFSKRKMVSNWNRYEETVLNRFEEEAEPSGALFEELLAMPISGGHLKMKHEHEWGKEKSELQMPWFQLDIKNVEKNLAAIPFFQRHNLPSSIFSDSHVQRMITRAKQNAASLAEVNDGILKMQNLCVSNTSKSEPSKSKSTGDGLVSDDKAAGLVEGFAVQESHDPLKNDDLDSLLALDVNPSNIVNVKPPVGGNNSAVIEDSYVNDTVHTAPFQQASPVSLATNPTSAQPTVSLDDWLDSILDD